MKTLAVSSAAAAAAPAALPAPAVAGRWAQLDALKGLGIVLVVLGHGINGLVAAHRVPADGWMAGLHYVIYLFHMPLFFLLSGLFFERRLDDSAAGFVRQLWVRLLWPYFLWASLQLALIAWAGPMVNVPAAWNAWRVVELAWAPASQYWFLHALALFQIGAYVLGRLGGPGAWLPAALLLLVLAAALVAGGAAGGSYLPFAAWFLVGAAVGAPRFAQGWHRLQAWGPRRAGLPLSGLLVLLCLVQVPGLRQHGVGYHDLAALGAQLAGLAAAIACCARLNGTRAALLLTWLGRRSMSIFLLHVMVVAGCRIVLWRLAPELPAAFVLALSVSLGVLLPCGAAWLAQRAGLSALLGLDRADPARGAAR